MLPTIRKRTPRRNLIPKKVARSSLLAVSGIFGTVLQLSIATLLLVGPDPLVNDSPFPNVTFTSEVAKCPGFASDPRNQIVGTPASETLTGTTGPDIICGLGGNDRLEGGAGDDVLLGGIGIDALSGSAGTDRLDGGTGRDSLSGGAGADTLIGGTNGDTATYGGSPTGVTVNLSVTPGTGSGGDAQGDSLSGIENLWGTGHIDSLTGSTAANTIRGYGSGDTLKGLGGTDTLDYTTSIAGVTVDLRGSPATVSGGHAEGDVVSLFERVVGSGLADVLHGNNLANWLTGAAGNDSLFGYGGDDRLLGQAGVDSFDGGPGTDFCDDSDSETALGCEPANKAPSDISLANRTVDENQPAGIDVGLLSSVDQDIGDSHTYSLVPGSGSIDNSFFTISSDMLRTAATFNFETKKSYSIRIRSTDSGGLFREEAFTISIADINDDPVATDDVFDGAIGNTKFSVGVTVPGEPVVTIPGPGVLEQGTDDSDEDVPAQTLTVTSTGAIPTSQGGTATMNSDGTFTYLPAPGHVGADTFSYTISDGAGGTGTGQVTVNVAQRVWYVNNAASPTTPDGRSTSPFTGLNQLNGLSGDVDGPGDIIFVYQGSGPYGGGLPLEANQDLFGQPHGLVVNGHNLVPAGGTNPTVTNLSGTGITLAEGAEIRRVNVAGTSGHGIAGTNVNVATIGTSTSVMNPGANFFAVALAGGSGNVSVGSSIANNLSGGAVSIANRTGGIVSFPSPISSAARGISLSNNSGATMNFTGGVTLSSGANAAFAATGGGTVSVTGVANTISTSTGVPLTITNTNIGPADVTFRSISSNGAPNGIVVSNAGSSGNLAVTGTGMAGTGGTIANSTGDAVRLINTSFVLLDQMNISNAGQDGVDLSGVSGFDMTGTVINDSGNHGVNADGVSGVDLTGVQIIGAGNGNDEHAMRMMNWTGSGTLTSTVIDGAEDDGVNIDNASGSLGLTVRSAEFKNLDGPFGNHALAVSANGTSNVTLDVENSLFRNVNGDSVLFGGGAFNASGTHTLRFVNNDVDQTSAGHGGSVAVSGQDNTTSVLNIRDNTFVNVGGNGLISTDANDSSTIRGTIENNSITSAPGVGMFISVDEAATSKLIVNLNQIISAGSDGIQVANFGGTGVSNLDVVITNNTVNGHNGSASPGIPFVAGIAVFGFEDNTCLALKGNTVANTPVGYEAYHLDEGSGVFRFEENPDTAATTLSSSYVSSTNTGNPVGINGTIDLTNGGQCARP